MAWYRAGGGGGGVPASLKSDMNAVFNKKFGTSTDYPPTGWPDDVNIMGPLPKGKASGSIAHITDGADDVPTSSCEVTIAPTLTGVSSVSVVRTGKNLLDASTAQGTDIVWFYYADGILLKKGVTYTFSCGNYGTGSLAFFGTDHTTEIAYESITASSASLTYTPSDDVVVCPRILQNGLTASDVINPMLEVGSTASAYEAFVSPTTYTASLGRTVYGGSVDIVNGTGTQTYYKHTYTGDNLSSVSLNYGSTDEGYTHLYFYTSGLPIALNPSGSNVLCDSAVWNASASGSAVPSGEGFRLMNTGSGDNQRPTVYLYINRTWANANEFKAWLNENPFTVVYALDTPTDFTFDGVEVPTRLAVNNFFSDVGDVSMEYRKDIGLAIGLNKYRYLRWKISATRTTSSYCQMSDIEFTDANGNTFTFPTGTTVTASTSATSGSSPAYIVDGNTATKFCGNWVTGGITLNIDLGMGNVIDVSVYKNFSWYTANDATDRDPKTWELYGIDNANNEILLCSRDYTPTTDRKALADTVTITPLE